MSGWGHSFASCSFSPSTLCTEWLLTVALKKHLAAILIRAWNLPFRLKDTFSPQKISQAIVPLGSGWEWVTCTCPWCGGLSPLMARPGHMQGVTSSLFRCQGLGYWRQKVGLYLMRQLVPRLRQVKLCQPTRPWETVNTLQPPSKDFWDFSGRCICLLLSTKETEPRGSPGRQLLLLFFTFKMKSEELRL